MSAPKAVQILGGSGGMHIGFSRQGFDTIAAFEADDGYGRSFRLNNPDLPHVVGTKEEWIAAAQELMSEHEITLVFGHPPCQGLSGANKQASADHKKNRKFVEFAETAMTMNPAYAVFENIPRMLGLGRKIVAEVDELAQSRGYTLTIHRHMVSEFGVSQVRRRVMFVLERDDCRVSWPSEPGIEGPTVWEVLSDLADVEPWSPDPRDVEDDIAPTEAPPLDYAGPPHNEWQEMLRNGSEKVTNHKLFQVHPKWATLPPGKPWFKHPDGDKVWDNDEIARIEENRLYHSCELFRLHPDRIGPTFTGMRNKMHPTLTRRISVREGARIMGFPDTWLWASDNDLQQIAAGVCPPVCDWFGQVLMAELAGTEMPAPAGRLF